jgi:hypothetical protein
VERQTVASHPFAVRLSRPVARVDELVDNWGTPRLSLGPYFRAGLVHDQHGLRVARLRRDERAHVGADRGVVPCHPGQQVLHPVR